ncbi:uncharacterized protein BXZ73DRAFT_102283 [Epithele typhae]|uniref:uncharacterized protein n=1 Tax=Epithele typhae TaxID=378194 RepID=UPI0020077990|nr:uncharacterized protein BXZ73DRAFT_102283 [Epithele typhae]KAH9928441.1 hypothetical protein BXZ73DRAFT_102283 [Epithele typhae]
MVRAAANELRSLAKNQDTPPVAQSVEPPLLPPIHTIPAEILAVVFQHAAIWPPKSEEDYLIDYPRMVNRLQLCAVCRRWRAVTLSMASLWSTIETYRFDNEGRIDPSVSEHAQRIRHLVIMGRWDPESHMKAVDFDLPNLEEITVIGNVARLYRFPHRDGGSDMFPNALQNLRMVVLSNITFFPSLPYRSITHLSLSSTYKVFARSLLDILDACSLTLRSLAFYSVHLHNRRGQLYTVRLPRLQYVFIYGDRFPWLPIPKLHLPSSAAMHVVTTDSVSLRVPSMYTPHVHWTTLELDFSPLKVTVLLAGALEAHAQLSFRYFYSRYFNKSEDFWDVLQRLKEFIPWKQLVAVTLRAAARVHTAVTFVANCLALARGGKIASLRVIVKRPGVGPCPMFSRLELV